MQLNNQINKKEWSAIARPNQLPPGGIWNIWLILAGRGFGKTRAAAEAIKQWVLSGKCKRVALIGNTIQEAKQVMIEGESGLLSISAPNDGIEFYSSKRLLQWKNGAIATIYGAENYEQLRGPQFDAAWIDEFAKFRYPKESFEQLSFSLRLGTHPKTILTTTPRPIPFLKELLKRNDIVTTRGTSLENLENLSPTFLKQLEFLKGTKLEAQEIFAEILEKNNNTLWSWEDIEKCYKTPPHHLSNIIIAVDPALTNNASSNETGIIIAGTDAYNKAYILEDMSIACEPDVWVRQVISAYYKYKAKKVIIETNAGGDFILSLFKNIDQNVKIKTVFATTSKIQRAEQVVILYQKQSIFHAKQFHQLEMQMATYEGKPPSPDRLDAMVWAMHELFNIEKRSKSIIWSQ